MWLLLVVVILVLVLGPGLWVRYQLNSGQKPIDNLPGTGGEFATHLIEKLQLNGVTLEETPKNTDHYDPLSRTVRLGAENLRNKSLTAVAVAAHEVGHAIQHHSGYAPLLLRGKLVRLSVTADRIAMGLMIAAPILFALSKNPRIMLFFIAMALGAALVQTLVHLITLPVEFDASFGRALPIIEQGQYLLPHEIRICRRILLACALTYVSQSLMSLLNLHRWLMILRR